MSIYDDVRRVLRSAPARRIDFVCQGVRVNGALFERVASAVGSADARNSVSVAVDATMDRGTGAYYHPLTNALFLRDNVLSGDRDEVSVLHECVHCAFDLDRRVHWRWFGQEACAYIAGAAYAIHKGLPMSLICSWGALYSLAWNVASHLSPGARFAVTWEQYLPLRTQLLAEARTPGSAYYGFADDLCYTNNGPSGG
ncbi:MAG TPA: hypothetical protein VGB66_11275 [Longimicrobium sp.]|jgi:hypothetical protein